MTRFRRQQKRVANIILFFCKAQKQKLLRARARYLLEWLCGTPLRDKLLPVCAPERVVLWRRHFSTIITRALTWRLVCSGGEKTSPIGDKMTFIKILLLALGVTHYLLSV
ncbi:hypothetical protein CEXT_127781 [Caerostris extrusa]|uniref:Uncharacterized protein n=1 Tax=Caerostris extrusa TaxID=172846 RepID=A0AAV4TD09_CAEEX|nr:hypothetical protein CEXT_127781 [Caerostris extrusa]